VQDVDKAIRANFAWDVLAGGYIVSSADNIAQELYYKDYRKASDVAEKIFAEFRNAMRTEISRNEELFAEDEDDFYEGRNDAFRTAINCLAELKRKYESEKDK
jgi:L-fucose mutarotase/ribose pyranase (RbsD/FucU family)